MVDCGSKERVLRVRNLQEYFRSSIDEAIAHQRVEIDPHAAHYVVNLLTLFSRSDELYQDDGERYGIQPLALMLADASDAPSPEQRTALLQRIGDVALFISGFFSRGLADKAVDIDYYIHMGGNAYGSLSDEVRGTFRGNAFASIYRELARKFQVLVDVLHEVSEGPGGGDTDLLRAYEVWSKTGSERARQLMLKNNISPLKRPISQRH